MKFRWQGGGVLRREAECRTKCFSLMPVNSVERKSHAEVQLSQNEGDEMLPWQVIL